MSDVTVRRFSELYPALDVLWESELRQYLHDCGCPNVEEVIAEEKIKRSMTRVTEGESPNTLRSPESNNGPDNFLAHGKTQSEHAGSSA